MSAPAGAARGRLGPLVRLHLVLTWRPVGSEKAAGTIGTVVLIIVMAVFGLVLGAAGFGLSGSMEWGARGQNLVLWVGSSLLFLSLLFVGLFQEGVGGGIDVSPLFHMPIAPAEMVRAGLISRFLGPWTLPPAGFFAGCAAGSAVSGRFGFALAVIPAAALWCAHAFLTLMAADFLLFNLRRSRRLTEALGLLGTLFVVAWMVVQNGYVLQHHGHSSGPDSASGIVGLWNVLEPVLLLLPGFSAASWAGAGWQAALRLPVALAEAAGLYWAAGYLLRRLTEQGAVEGRGKRGKVAEAGGPARPGLLDPWAVWPFAAKDFRYFARDPFLKSLLIGIVVTPAVLLFVFLGQGGAFGDTFLHYGIPLFLLMSFSRVSTNHLGMERGGLLVLLGSPAPRWRPLLGKNLVLFSLFVAMMSVPVAVLLWRGAKAGLVAADAVMALSAALIYFGAGNFMSILMPLPMAPKGRRLVAQVPVGRQFLAMFVQTALMGLSSLVSLPVIVGRVALGALGATAGWVGLVGGAMLLYAALVYTVLLVLAARLMPSREPDIYEALLRTQT